MAFKFNPFTGTLDVVVEGVAGITVKESDGTPSITATAIAFNQVNNFTVTDSGSGLATIGLNLGGSDTELQYNKAGAFGGTNNLVWDAVNDNLSLQADNSKLFFGAADDASITYDGSSFNFDASLVTASLYKYLGTGAVFRNTTNDNVQKVFNFFSASFDSDEEDILGIRFQSNSADNTLFLGCAAATGFNACTKIIFQTAASINTLNGTERAAIEGNDFMFKGCSVKHDAPSGAFSAMFLHRGAGNFGYDISFGHLSASPADDDFVGSLTFFANSSTGVQREYAVMDVKSTTVANGAEVGEVLWTVRNSGSTTEMMRLKGNELSFFGVTPAARAAAYTPTNVNTDRAYDADSTTLEEIADVLGTLISDLQAYGLLQ